MVQTFSKNRLLRKRAKAHDNEVSGELAPGKVSSLPVDEKAEKLSSNDFLKEAAQEDSAIRND